MKAIFAGLAALAVTAAAAEAAPVKTRIDTGILVGDSRGGVESYKGVPFAQAPVGNLRWASPMRPASWGGERQATEFELPCPQTTAPGRANGGGVSGPTSEDCLYLNVWAPANARNAPVMLWLYGGAGTLGAGSLGAYYGDSFAQQGVIVVTINYRLGALGNFVHPALERTRLPGEPIGNYALQDAIAGLQWVQRNIEAFGGNPENVTLFGQSAGGIMVSSLLASPMANGLYDKAIIHSGARVNAATPLSDASERGVEVATALGLPGAAATLEQLRGVPVADLLRARGNISAMSSVVDGVLKVESTETAFEKGTVIDVPLIVGSNNGEGGADSANTLVNMAAASGAPAWQYYFTYVPAWRREEQPRGAPHSAEIPYAFASLATSATGGGDRVTDRDRAVSARMNSCWVAFAKQPVSERTINCAEGFTWQARTESNNAVAVFDERPSAGDISTILAEIAARSQAQAAARARTRVAAQSAPTLTELRDDLATEGRRQSAGEGYGRQTEATARLRQSQ